MSSIPATSQAWQVHPLSQSHHEYDTAILQNLVLKDIETTQPGPGEVLVRMYAASLNFRDLLVIANSPNYPGRTSSGLVPCSDGGGEIASVGEGSEWKVGERLFLMPNHGWLEGGQENFKMDKELGAGEMQGTLGQYRVVEGWWLVLMLTNLSFEEAASLPTAGVPAMRALSHNGITEEGSLDLSGKSVLVQGTGGSSIFALQLASAAGARVVATSSSVEKLHSAKGLGASDLINYKTIPEWADEVLKVTGGKGVDLVVEVGGAGTIQQGSKAIHFGGTVVIIGI